MNIYYILKIFNIKTYLAEFKNYLIKIIKKEEDYEYKSLLESYPPIC
jgi:hypothetical protein